jgi:hypothetical protein
MSMCARAQLFSVRAERAEANFAPRGKSFASACFKTVKLCAAEIGFKMVKVCGRPETQPPPYRVGPSAVKANSRERATLAHFVVVRRVTGHSCSAGDGASCEPGLVV